MIKKDVSAAELEVMEQIWESSKPVTITDIWQSIDGRDWTYQTVQTFVNRLNAKGFIKIVSKRVRSFEYVPEVSKAEYLADTKGHLFGKGKSASLADIVDAFYRTGRFNTEDLDDLELRVKMLRTLRRP